MSCGNTDRMFVQFVQDRILPKPYAGRPILALLQTCNDEIADRTRKLRGNSMTQAHPALARLRGLLQLLARDSAAARITIHWQLPDADH